MKKFAKTSMAVLLYIASYTSVFPAHALDEIFAQKQNIHNTSVDDKEIKNILLNAPPTAKGTFEQKHRSEY